MYKRILVPVDLSKKSPNALHTARQLAEVSGGEIILLHVIEPIPHTEVKEMKEFYGKLETRAVKWLKDLTAADKGQRRARIQTEIVYGKRAQTIVDFARRRRADLIILNSHKVKPGSGFPSISYEVAVLAACPVLLIK